MANFFRFKREIALGLGLASFAFPKARWPLAIGALGVLLAPQRLAGFEGKSIVITGGSRGLGLALARKLLLQGARVTLLARDTDELERAEKMLNEEIPDVSSHLQTLVCDVTQCEHLDTALAQTRARFGQIDGLINNAGAITVGPFQALDDSDFRALVALHLSAVVTATRLVRPYFHMAGGGMIINISSLGGLMPIPHMSAYAATKFALGGFSESVAAELAKEKIQVTTVYPGLIRTGSPIQGIFKGDHEREFAWFAAGDNAPLVSMSADRAASQILTGALDGRRQIVLTVAAQLGSLARVLLPESFHLLTQWADQLLPSGTSGGTSKERRTGAMSQSDLPIPFAATRHAAEQRFNQQEKSDAQAALGLPMSSAVSLEKPVL